MRFKGLGGSSITVIEVGTTLSHGNGDGKVSLGGGAFRVLEFNYGVFSGCGEWNLDEWRKRKGFQTAQW